MTLPRDLQALAYVISQARPAWPRAAVERALSARVTTELNADGLAQLGADCFDAALNPDLHSPGVLAHHRRADRPLVDRSPQGLPRCETCGHVRCACTPPVQPSPTVTAFMQADQELRLRQHPYRRRIDDDPTDMEAREQLRELAAAREQLRETLEAS